MLAVPPNHSPPGFPINAFKSPNRTIKSVEIILLTTPPRNSMKVRQSHVWCTCMSSSTQLLNSVWESQFHCKSVSTPTPQKAFQHRWGCRKYRQTAASWVGMSEHTMICVSSNTKSSGSVHKLRIDETYTRNRRNSPEGIHSFSLIVDMGWSQGSKSIYRTDEDLQSLCQQPPAVSWYHQHKSLCWFKMSAASEAWNNINFLTLANWL